MRYLFFFLGYVILSVFPVRAQDIPIWKLPDLQQVYTGDSTTTYVINFWATWCVPCIREMPHFEQLHKDGEGQNTKVLLVSLDFADQVESRVKPFIARRNISAPIVILDEPNYNRWIPQISDLWSGAIPATLCVNISRGIYEFKEGEFKEGQLHEWLEQLGVF